jgi:hypothetical protein
LGAWLAHLIKENEHINIKRTRETRWGGGGASLESLKSRESGNNNFFFSAVVSWFSVEFKEPSLKIKTILLDM